MKIALCNEVLQPMPFVLQCVHAKALGYDGLELAPFTISDTPQQLSRAAIVAARRAASDAGIAITGLHWLLLRPAGLSITSAEGGVRSQTVDVMRALIDLCAELGGGYLVHGSPAQRRIPPGDTRKTALTRATECWSSAGEHARMVGVTYCIEPLSRDQTDLVNTVAEAAELVDKIGNRALRTMIDTCSAGLAETEELPAIITRYVGSGHIGHVQVNDRNRRGPGEGNDTFVPIFKALRESRYAGVVAAEPFIRGGKIRPPVSTSGAYRRRKPAP